MLLVVLMAVDEWEVSRYEADDISAYDISQDGHCEADNPCSSTQRCPLVATTEHFSQSKQNGEMSSNISSIWKCKINITIGDGGVSLPQYGRL